MSTVSYVDRIKPTDKGIYSYLEDLRNKNYQIPTFQREVVWEKDNVKKLWDSIYKFYPLGSILIWKTDVKLQNHRKVGGHVIGGEEFERVQYQYILDGQQRTTSLLTSIYGGEIEGNKDFKPSLYVDLTIEDLEDIDDDSYKKRFLFWDEIDDDNKRLRANMKRKRRYDRGLIVKLKDIKENYGLIEENLVNKTEENYSYNHPVRKQLRKIKSVLDNYRISLIELKGIQVSEVCEIFERINQEGKPLNIFDIIVAKTFRPSNEEQNEFYLRDIINRFKTSKTSEYMKIDDLTYLQILAVLINKDVEESNILNITDRYLNNIRAEQIEYVWDEAQKAILKTFDFFENHLRIKGPHLIPFRYFYMTISYYFYKNKRPDYKFINKYFWYYSFHREDLLRNTTHLWNHISFLEGKKNDENPEFDKFTIDRNDLRTASYSSRGRLSRSILSLYASKDPRDWENPNRSVLSDVYYTITDKPNLHHIFPLDYIEKNIAKNKLEGNSLMNIAYLTQITNIRISNKNPIEYIKDYDSGSFSEVLKNHLISSEILDWSRKYEMPENSLGIFIESRLENILSDLKEKLLNIKFEVIDTASVNEWE